MILILIKRVITKTDHVLTHCPWLKNKESFLGHYIWGSHYGRGLIEFNIEWRALWYIWLRPDLNHQLIIPKERFSRINYTSPACIPAELVICHTYHKYIEHYLIDHVSSMELLKKKIHSVITEQTWQTVENVNIRH